MKKWGLKPKDIIFNFLRFPVGTGDQQYIGSAEETVKGIRIIKETMPDTLTILGVSNVSFGLPPVGREVLNAVYLYHCTQAGLDYAIVNTEKLARFALFLNLKLSLQTRYYLPQLIKRCWFTDFYRDKKKETEDIS